MKIPLYSQDGGKKGDVTVPDEIFGIKPNQTLMHRMLILQQGNRRRPIAHTLTKGEVRGGGKKPYRQKHTGNARQGSITNPHFRGGGVAFGPRNVRNFTVKASKKERRNALVSALSAKCSDGRIAALEGYVNEQPKTKLFATMLKKLPFEKSILFVLPARDETVYRSSRNIPHIKTITVQYLNIEDILKYHDVVFFKEALSKL